MKTTRVVLILLVTAMAGTIASAQTITEFFVGKLYDRTQADSSGSTAGATPYGFFAQVSGTGLSGTYTVSTPGGSVSSPITLTGDSTNVEYEQAFAYATPTDLNNAYNEGDYSMALPNTNGVPQSVSGLSLTGDAFPNAFSITNGTWSGGRLLIDPTQDFTITFDAFSGFSAGDFIQLNIDPSYDFNSTTAVTFFTVTANTLSLAPGQTTSAELVFARVMDTDSSILGATGSAAFVTLVSFDIQAIPEPSTYAAILGVLVLAGVVIHRRRRTA